MMFDATTIINNFDDVEVPTATTFRRITSSSRSQKNLIKLGVWLLPQCVLYAGKYGRCERLHVC
jgi:hypothetical protein